MKNSRWYRRFMSFICLLILVLWSLIIIDLIPHNQNTEILNVSPSPDTMLDIIKMENHPKIGDSQEYVESVWGEWMSPANLLLFTSYQPRLYLDINEDPIITVSYHPQNKRLDEIHFILSRANIKLTLDEAIDIAREYIDCDFLFENYYLSKSQHIEQPDGSGRYYQDWVWKDSSREDLPTASIVISFWHNTDGMIHAFSFGYKSPKITVKDGRVFSEWNFDIWVNE